MIQTPFNQQLFIRMLLVPSIFLFTLSCTIAQKYVFPELPEEGKALADFIPAEYTLIESAQGDLNQDGRKDLVWVMEYNEVVTERLKTLGKTQTLDTKPRILGIAFGYPLGVLGLEFQNNDFVLRRQEGANGQEPLDKLSIDAKGHLHIGFRRVYTEKEWEVNYEWKYAKNNFILIGATSLDYDKLTGVRHKNTYDFMEHKVKHSYDNALKRKRRPNISNFYLDKTQPKTFETFSRPLTWKILEGFIL